MNSLLFLILAASLGFGCLGLHNVAADSLFERLVLEASAGGRYMAPASVELNKAERLFRRMFRMERLDTLQEKWNTLGFEMLRLNEAGKAILVLREGKNQKKGRGFYAFQMGERSNILEAPHSFTDLNTREIAIQLFLEHTFAAGAWNTVTREDADMAHLSESYFIVFSRAFARERPNQYLIQLHGFSEENHDDGTFEPAGMIVSGGTKTLSLHIFQIGTCLKQRVNQDAKIFPTEIEKLGGTTNAIGRMLRSEKHSGFVHLEMDEGIRRNLSRSPELRQELVECLP